MAAQPAFEFRWLSLSGISTMLFLGYGGLNTLVGLVIPFLSRRPGAGGFAPQPALD